MSRLGIREEDLVEKFVAGSGPGGQKINKTASRVYLRHEPTGLEIQCQAERSQSLNRLIARERLCERLETERLAKKAAKARERARERYRKRRRSAAEKAKMIESKRRRSETKKRRGRVSGDG